MSLALISFTRRGSRINAKLCSRLRSLGYSAFAYIPDKYDEGWIGEDLHIKAMDCGLKDWTGRRFLDSEAILFIGASGIAVRAIAPFVADKRTDPAVLVMDETGRYCISLLSGHLGQANKWTALAAELTGAQPVITTATDLNGKFAVDVFAGEHNLKLLDMVLAKKISVDILEEKRVGFFSDFEVEGELPVELSRDILQEHNIRVTIKKETEMNTLSLIPGVVTVGIGCRKGISLAAIETMIWQCCDQCGILRESICSVASIDRKSGEPGLIEFAGKYNVPFLTFSSEELQAVEGDFSDSDFVKTTTGVGNVCERAAVLASGGRLILEKQACMGVTVALACKDWRVKL